MFLCAMLWARPGHEDALVAYEDAVLGLLDRHGASIVSRVRGDGADGRPLEVQVIEFPDQAAIAAFTGDPDRVALSADRDAAIARTEVFPVSLL